MQPVCAGQFILGVKVLESKIVGITEMRGGGNVSVCTLTVQVSLVQSVLGSVSQG
jgi:hypothetical protein